MDCFNKKAMTRSKSTLIEPHSEPKRIIRRRQQWMQNHPPTIIDPPRENPLFEDPLEPQPPPPVQIVPHMA